MFLRASSKAFFCTCLLTASASPMVDSSTPPSPLLLDRRKTLSRPEARDVYDRFAEQGHVGGKDVESGYGGPAIAALLEMAHFESAKTVLDYGCGQGKLAELIYSNQPQSKVLKWKGFDQSPKMVERFRERCCQRFPNAQVELIESGDPVSVQKSIQPHSIDRFVSTYCLDLLSEDDMYKVLDLAQYSLDPDNGLLLLAGITWGYKASWKTFFMTALWELLYKVQRRRVGGCRPQLLVPYLEAKGWRIQNATQTMPNGFPWMVSEVVSAKPPISSTSM